MIRYLKIREVKGPQRAHLHDAGVDFYLPELNEQFVQDLKTKNPHIKRWWEVLFLEDNIIGVLPGMRITIPSGIKVWIEDKESADIAFNKSGLASNKGIVVTAQVVDSDYTGEVHLGILNTSNSTIFFKPGDKVAQFLHIKVILDEYVEVDEAEYNKISLGSDRGEGGFGSSDNK